MKRAKDKNCLPTNPFKSRMSRPEGSKPPDLFYDEKESRKYDSSSRMISIQKEISERAIEMLGGWVTD